MIKKMNRNRLFHTISAAAAAALLTISGNAGGCEIFAADTVLKAVNEQGYPVLFNENHYAVNAGSVRFRLDESSLKEGEVFVYEDGGMTLPVTGGEYLMSPEGAEDIRFVMFYISREGILKPLSSEPYVVEFRDKVTAVPRVSLNEGSEETAPCLIVSPRAWVDTFVRIKSDTETALYHITDQDTKISFPEDGVYQLRVYTMDGKGNKTYAKDLAEEVIRDSIPPEITEVTLDGKKEDKKALYSGDIVLRVQAQDELSGVKSVFIEAGKGQVYEATELKIRAPFQGKISIWAEDQCGNISSKVTFDEVITADHEGPDIRIGNDGVQEDQLLLHIRAKDELSGVKRMTIRLNEEEIYRGDEAEKTIGIDLKKLFLGENRLSVTAEDEAGNKSEGSMSLERQDDTPPVIRFYGIIEQEIYAEDAVLKTVIRDDSGECANSWLLTEIRDQEGNLIFRQKNDPADLSFTRSGIVTVTAYAEDPYGNRAERKITFTIDKDAPKINGLDGLDGKELKEFSMEEPPEELIDDLSYVNYDLYLNGLEYDGSAVTRSGKYVLKLIASDEAGNRSSKSASFTIKNETKKEIAKTPAVSADVIKRGTDGKKQEKVIKKQTISVDQTKRYGEPVIVRFEETENGNGKTNDTSIPVSASEDAKDEGKRGGVWDWIKYGIMRMFQGPFRLS